MMSKKLAFELVVIIFAAAVASYFYGLSVGVQSFKTLASQPEDSKYKELFLVDPLSQDTNLRIIQDISGTLNNVIGDRLSVDTSVGIVTIQFNRNTLAPSICEDITAPATCSATLIDVNTLKGKDVLVTVLWQEYQKNAVSIRYMKG